MDLLGTKPWMWINGICLIVVGAVSLVPSIWAVIAGDLLNILKIVVAMISLIVAFRERDLEQINGKLWLLTVGLILLFMGIIPYFPAVMMDYPTIIDFLNTLKVVLGGITFLVIVIDWPKLGL
ncbi:MAG: hypothetical protein P1Q69_06070 [Candidatus Thorarchaeota archaeon]|nr:hypothetical protein [Candidatus Thorarchaeota archaeon]